MKRPLTLLLALLLTGMTLTSCRTPPAPPSDSYPPLPQTSETAPDTTAEEPTDTSADTTPEGEPMERISTYQNPLLTYQTEHAWPGYGFGDPFVMRHNGMYYLYVSTKDGCVGIKCWSSPDLVNWTYEGFCSNDPITRGAYAPEVYYYNGYFYMYTSPAGNGHYVLRSTSPTKGFQPVTGNMGMSIDGSVFMDHDGSWYFYTAGSGAMQVYNMSAPTSMRGGRPISSVSVNGGWTEGGMVVFHDGRYYITYTGNHVLSPSYRILYGVSEESPLSFDPAVEENPLLISTAGDILGIGHSSTVKGPDLDSYYIVYHALLDTLPNRTMNIDRIVFNGDRMEIMGPTTVPQQVPDLPDVYHRFEPGSSLKGWTLTGSVGAGRGGITLNEGSALISKTSFVGDFTAEYNIISVEPVGLASAIFAYTDDNNFGTCCFSPSEQKVIIEITVDGQTTRTEASTIRSFREETRFDCLQSIQIERNGSDYSFYMNDRLLCRIENSPLAGGSIGYVAKAGSASFGFIGGTGAVGGQGGGNQYKALSHRGGFIPAYEAVECPDTLTLSDGRRTVPMTEGDSLTYRVLASETGLYDLALLCRGIGQHPVSILVSVDGSPVGSTSLPAAGLTTASAILRGIPMEQGQHTVTLAVTEGGLQAESLTIRRGELVSALAVTFSQDAPAPRYSDGGWDVSDGELIMSGNRAYGKLLYGSPNWGDYTAEVIVTPNSSPNCGLLVRTTDPGNPSFLNATPSREDAVTATDWLMGYFIGLSSDGVLIGKQSYGYRELARADGSFEAGKSYRLTAICEGARIRVYVNGELYLDYTDPDPFLQGMAGLRTHNCAVRFRDLTVKP